MHTTDSNLTAPLVPMQVHGDSGDPFHFGSDDECGLLALGVSPVGGVLHNSKSSSECNSCGTGAGVGVGGACFPSPWCTTHVQHAPLRF